MGEVIIFESMCLENVEHWAKENISLPLVFWETAMKPINSQPLTSHFNHLYTSKLTTISKFLFHILDSSHEL